MAGAAEPNYATFGALDYSKDWYQSGNDWRDCIYYQAMMAGKRAVSWVLARPEVDASRIGVTGASFGGIFSSLLAAIDLRIRAVAPTVYAAGFGPDEPSYNNLSPKKFTPEQVQAWRARFDSELLLSKRTAPIPILYLVSTNDHAFTILKTARHYLALPEPKQLVISPNQGHNFLNFQQTVLFFGQEFLGKGMRPHIGEIALSERDGGWTVSVKADPADVEFFYALEPLPDLTVRADHRVELSKWEWIRLAAVHAESQMHTATLTLSAEARAQTRAVHLFACARNAGGLEACSSVFTLLLAGGAQ